ncbi:hypothetical protein [Archangium sp.]|uniref:hypothetical protein n=1 Tax=Archangium sp. TaxID=1872627 RepID=UPI002D23365B|nr:hypothetical protein [Archangium sp.]HYO53023.1 hypothetical protein [Archangium sp.]
MTLKKAMTTSSILVAALWIALVGGCGGTQMPPQDGSDSNLQGDDLNAGDSQGSGVGEEGTSSGNDEGKVTLCHIPPGNPARAHTITVGQPAVRAHLQHGDTLGACEGTDAGTPEQDGGTTEPDAGEPGPQPDAGSGAPDAGNVCVPSGSECGVDAPCCSGLQCVEGRCTIILS